MGRGGRSTLLSTNRTVYPFWSSLSTDSLTNFQTRVELMEHISTALENGISQTEVDNQAVRVARAELTKLPIAERAYQRLQADFLDSSIPPFRLTDIISFESAQKFTFRNNGELTRSIPGLYTFNGFHGIFNVEKSKMLGNLMASSWVYGEEATGTYDISKDEIEKKLEQRYFQDYIYFWQSFIDDLSLNQYSSPAEGVNITDVLAGSEAPIKNIITAVQKNVQLTKLPVSDNQKAAGKVVANAAEIAMQTKANRIKRFFSCQPYDHEEHHQSLLLDESVVLRLLRSSERYQRRCLLEKGLYQLRRF